MPAESIGIEYSIFFWDPTSAKEIIALILSDFYFSLNKLPRILNKGGLIRIQFRAPNQYSANFKSVGFKTYNFENQSIIFYWKKIFGLPITIARLYKHNHWGGQVVLYLQSQLLNFLRKKGLKLVLYNLIWESKK